MTETENDASVGTSDRTVSDATSDCELRWVDLEGFNVWCG